MPRPDIDAIAAVTEDCANSRFPTIRRIAGRMNELLGYAAELQARVDVLTDQVAGRDATIQRVRDYAADLRSGRTSRFYAIGREISALVDGYLADDGSPS